MIERTFEYYGVCTRVIDGDTIELDIDMGFQIHHIIRVRMLNVMAPEIFSGPPEVRERGQTAKRFLEFLVLNQFVKVQTVKDHTSFNRYIATVWVNQPDDITDNLTGDLNVNEAMTQYITDNKLNG